MVHTTSLLASLTEGTIEVPFAMPVISPPTKLPKGKIQSSHTLRHVGHRLQVQPLQIMH